MQIEALIHDGAQPPNASFRGSVVCGVLTFSGSFVVPDVFDHEFQHGMEARSARLEYMDESAALDEHLADFFGAMIDFTKSDGDWRMGEDMSSHPLTNPYAASCSSYADGSVRDLSNPPACGDPDHRDPAVSGDGLVNASDNCPRTASLNQTDQDEDDCGDVCANCVSHVNPDQEDLDQDGEEDPCDLDPDGDRLLGENDNCPMHYNPDQADNDGDGLGLWCDAGEKAFLDGLRQLGEMAIRFEYHDPSSR